MYRLLLLLYPSSFRAEYGEEMCRDFARQTATGFRSLQNNLYPAESVRIQFWAEFLNMFNRTLWGNIDTSPSLSM